MDNDKNNGEKIRRSVLGDEHVEQSNQNISDFNAPFVEFITQGAWGTVWAGDAWTKRERSIVTIALLAAQGHDDELEMHIRAAANTGATRDDIREAFMHVAVYAGVPSANRAFRIAMKVFDTQVKS